ncbi:MAG: RdgB/HAM1 family non-canonical purine NTP pyrophosphatase [Tissierellia bacterium]|nr:RdgB/HAM1 family non-canonical purine NTP pyrophosphatase [Tissierellia bacterium]
MLVLSTDNPHKLKEIREILGADEILSKSQYGAPEGEIVEDAPTLEGNAKIKVAAIPLKDPGDIIIGDDTGLFVDALDGRPGVHTARFAGEGATDGENRARLLEELQGVEDRRAHFKTVIAIAHGGGIHFVTGICRGTIATEERGERGFGYDSLFIPEGYDKTFAELPAQVKNTISHRARAMGELKSYLEERGE